MYLSSVLSVLANCLKILAMTKRDVLPLNLSPNDETIR